MALFITLILTCAFFSKALTLKCNACIQGTCVPNLLTCPSSCGPVTTTTYTDGKKVESNSKMTCGDPVVCVNGSINAGQNKMTLNSQCCNAELCNSRNAPDLPPQPLNGKQCYTCNNTDCSRKLACEGDETQCFITTAEVNGRKVLSKGCASKLFCGTNATQVLGPRAQALGIGAHTQCCTANLCNGARRLSFYFPILVPLLCLVVL